MLSEIAMLNLKLFTTSGCHLCEQAAEMLDLLQAEQRCTWQPIEIADQDELIEHYGVRIPVVVDKLTGKELGWPFTQQQLGGWLNDLNTG